MHLSDRVLQGLMLVALPVVAVFLVVKKDFPHLGAAGGGDHVHVQQRREGHNQESPRARAHNAVIAAHSQADGLRSMIVQIIAENPGKGNGNFDDSRQRCMKRGSINFPVMV